MRLKIKQIQGTIIVLVTVVNQPYLRVKAQRTEKCKLPQGSKAIPALWEGHLAGQGDFCQAWLHLLLPFPQQVRGRQMSWQHDPGIKEGRVAQDTGTQFLAHGLQLRTQMLCPLPWVLQDPSITIKMICYRYTSIKVIQTQQSCLTRMKEINAFSQGKKPTNQCLCFQELFFKKLFLKIEKLALQATELCIL